MWARAPTRNSTVAMRSSKEMPRQPGRPVRARAGSGTGSPEDPRAPGAVSPARCRSFTPCLAAAGRVIRRPPGFGCRVGHGEHPLDQVADQARVPLLDPLGQHQGRRLAQPLVVGQHELALEVGPVARPAPAPSSRRRRWPGRRPARRRSPEPMAKLTPSSQRPAARVMAGGVAGHQHPVGGQRRHGVVAALGDEVGGVLPQRWRPGGRGRWTDGP